MLNLVKNKEKIDLSLRKNTIYRRPIIHSVHRVRLRNNETSRSHLVRPSRLIRAATPHTRDNPRRRSGPAAAVVPKRRRRAVYHRLRRRGQTIQAGAENFAQLHSAVDRATVHARHIRDGSCDACDFLPRPCVRSLFCFFRFRNTFPIHFNFLNFMLTCWDRTNLFCLMLLGSLELVRM